MLLFFSRLEELRGEGARRNRTTPLAIVRERVERQRSVVVPPPYFDRQNSAPPPTASLDGLNLEIRGEVELTRNSVERLDTQVSTLHQDVATLSMEVKSL